MKLIIDVDEELYEAYKGKPPMLNYAGIDMAIANGIPYEERPQGEWIYHKANGNFSPYIECSVCHTENMLDGTSPKKYKLINKFCFNCGAEMGVTKNDINN
jgi:hypothetical protein